MSLARTSTTKNPQRSHKLERREGSGEYLTGFTAEI